MKLTKEEIKILNRINKGIKETCLIEGDEHYE